MSLDSKKTHKNWRSTSSVPSIIYVQPRVNFKTQAELDSLPEEERAHLRDELRSTLDVWPKEAFVDSVLLSELQAHLQKEYKNLSDTMSEDYDNAIHGTESAKPNDSAIVASGCTAARLTEILADFPNRHQNLTDIYAGFGEVAVETIKKTGKYPDFDIYYCRP